MRMINMWREVRMFIRFLKFDNYLLSEQYIRCSAAGSGHCGEWMLFSIV